MKDTHDQRGMDSFFMGSAFLRARRIFTDSTKKVHQAFVYFHESLSHYLYRFYFAVATERGVRFSYVHAFRYEPKARRTRAHLSRVLVIRDKLDRQNVLVCGQHLWYFRHS